ncbi:MAG TPA: N-acetylmuramoyl-L-alanine amidase, partial [Mycobacterium sp.]|nr:N-acetylmuramoyl-L-alanine amidase [Mycobacterium sp.]
MPSRRRAPTILLTAIVASVVVLPWTIDSASHHKPVAAATTRLTQQPLPALGPGVTVREVSQDEPFSMVALTGSDLTGTSARVRAKHADGSWSPWYTTEHQAEYDAVPVSPRPGPRPGPDGTEPVFVGKTTTVQIAITRPVGAPATAAAPNTAKPAKPSLGYVPATAERPFAQHVSAVLISPPRSPADPHWAPPAAVTTPGQPPYIIPRGHWGAAASRCGGPAAGSRVRAAVIHHTAGSNDYAPEDSAEIVRSIYAYHTQTLGWCDIGYNALVDKYGQVFEGRAGGIANPVQGTHAGGFNRDTWGVSMIGTFDHAPPPPIQVHAVGRLLGWRLGLDRDDPHGNVQLASAGGSATFVAPGAMLTLPTIFSHRDVDRTECPGDGGYAVL